MKGIIFDIKRFAVHDGPGIRATVFLKGCPLNCIWCHNPEGIDPAIVTVPKTYRVGDKIVTEQEVVGREVTVPEVMTELLKEKVFMDESGGGVTFSGGEPLMQADFLVEMLHCCRIEGMHTAVDTTGLASWETLKKVARYTDLFLYDLKLIHTDNHKQFTGVSNALILENLQRLSADKYPVRIRIPLIPDRTYTEENLSDILQFLGTLSHKPQGVDLLPFHNTAAHKYKRFDLKNNLQTVKNLPKSSVQHLKKRFESEGYQTTIGG